MAKDGFGKAIGDGKISLLRRKALTISLRQVGKGVGQASRLTFRQGDAGAMPRTATSLVNCKGVGNPRQRTLRLR
jgi:hypothetical protein